MMMMYKNTFAPNDKKKLEAMADDLDLLEAQIKLQALSLQAATYNGKGRWITTEKKQRVFIPEGADVGETVEKAIKKREKSTKSKSKKETKSSEKDYEKFLPKSIIGDVAERINQKMRENGGKLYSIDVGKLYGEFEKKYRIRKGDWPTMIEEIEKDIKENKIPIKKTSIEDHKKKFGEDVFNETVQIIRKQIREKLGNIGKYNVKDVVDELDKKYRTNGEWSVMVADVMESIKNDTLPEKEYSTDDYTDFFSKGELRDVVEKLRKFEEGGKISPSDQNRIVEELDKKYRTNEKWRDMIRSMSKNVDFVISDIRNEKIFEEKYGMSKKEYAKKYGSGITEELQDDLDEAHL